MCKLFFYSTRFPVYNIQINIFAKENMTKALFLKICKYDFGGMIGHGCSPQFLGV